jgi:hypothetical protein
MRISSSTSERRPAFETVPRTENAYIGPIRRLRESIDRTCVAPLKPAQVVRPRRRVLRRHR